MSGRLFSSNLICFNSLKTKFESFVKISTTCRVKNDFKYLNNDTFANFDGGFTILSEFKGFWGFFLSTYPHFPWNVLDADRLSNSYWNNGNHQRYFLELITHKIPEPILRQEDWRVLDEEVICTYHGRSLLVQNSVLNILKTNLPVFFWDNMWRFPTDGSYEEQRVFVDGCVIKFPFVERQVHLTLITYRAFGKFPGGHTMISQQNGSPQVIFYQFYKELQPQYGANVDIELWDKRNLVDRMILSVSWFVETKEHLSSISTKRFSKLPGGYVLLNGTGNVKSIFEQIYPEIRFEYKIIYKGFWKKFKNNLLIQKAMKIYNIEKKEDWYRISVEQFSKIYGKVASKKNMINLLEFWNPEEVWNYSRFSERINKRCTQKYLGSQLIQLIKGEVIFEDYVFNFLDKVYVFDFYIPGLNLVVEYQGEQHYYNVLGWLPLEEQLKRDHEKQQVCQQNGLKLLTVPYWWDHSLSTLSLLLSLPTNHVSLSKKDYFQLNKVN